MLMEQCKMYGRWSPLIKGVFAALLALQVASAGVAHAAAEKAVGKPKAAAKAQAKAPEVAITRSVMQLTLKDLGILTPMRLLSAEGRGDIAFSFHTSDVVEKLRLKLNYSYSPLLNPETSAVTILLNGQEVGKLTLSPEKAQGTQEVIEIDPVLLQEWNHMTFLLTSHVAAPLCDDPRSKNLWVQFDQRYTAIEADTATLPLTTDLSMFPMPFFDKHDIRDLKVRFVMPERPSWGALKSAGILSSWFGMKAEWRKVNFPVLRNQIDEHDAIVLATSGDRIAGIDLPTVGEGVASITMVENPKNPDARLMLVVGRDEAGLVEAVRALTLDKLPLGGNSVTVRAAGLPKRELMDAPKWLPTNRKIHVSELMKPEELGSTALYVTPYNMVLHLPPDIYRSETTSIPFDVRIDSSNNSRYLRRVEVMLNDRLIERKLFDQPADKEGPSVRHRWTINIPTYNLTGRDTITLNYSFIEKKTQICNTAFVLDTVKVDPNSTIDLSGQLHYSELPDLTYLAYTGFPFSRMANLADTAVLLPDAPDDSEIESMLVLLGHIGNKTAYPAVGLTVDTIRNAEKMTDKDMLVIGATKRLEPLLDAWSGNLPVDLRAEYQPIPYFGRRYAERWADWAKLNVLLKREKGNPGMVLAGFQSPLQSGRSVVMVAAEDGTKLTEEAAVVNTFYFAKDFDGNVSVIDQENNWDRVQSFERSPRYALGSLSLEEHFKRFIRHNPWLLLGTALLIATLFAALTYLRMQRKAKDRLSLGTME